MSVCKHVIIWTSYAEIKLSGWVTQGKSFLAKEHVVKLRAMPWACNTAPSPQSPERLLRGINTSLSGYLIGLIRCVETSAEGELATRCEGNCATSFDTGALIDWVKNCDERRCWYFYSLSGESVAPDDVIRQFAYQCIHSANLHITLQMKVQEDERF